MQRCMSLITRKAAKYDLRCLSDQMAMVAHRGNTASLAGGICHPLFARLTCRVFPHFVISRVHSNALSVSIPYSLHTLSSFRSQNNRYIASEPLSLSEIFALLPRPFKLTSPIMPPTRTASGNGSSTPVRPDVYPSSRPGSSKPGTPQSTSSNSSLILRRQLMGGSNPRIVV
jgi:hypothetical protein